MATTDARMGFRLPWSSDQRPDDEEPNGNQGGIRAEGSATGLDQSRTSPFPESTPMTEGIANFAAKGEAAAAPGQPSGSNDARTPGGRGPSKFMADLTKAMQAAAESAREEAVGRLQSEAKAAVEQVNVRSATEAADLRRQADEDVSEIREWSKAEINRIREETDEKIANRKRHLESEIEEQAARLERQIQRVHGMVSGYEAEVADFFQRLLSEEDPSRFAAMAGQLPEPPDLEGNDTTPPRAPSRNGSPQAAMPAPAVPAPTVPAPTIEPAPARDWAPEPERPAAVQVEPDFAPQPASAPQAEPAPQPQERSPWGDLGNGSRPPVSDYGNREFAPERPSEPVAETPEPDAWGDPRLAALRMSPDFAAAEAEAFDAARSTAATEEIPTIGDDALAARLAGLVGPDTNEAPPAPLEPNATQVVVTGLISVASIASFKRHLGRLPGVQSVGVSSGPDGEFVFAVRHTPDVILREAIPALPAFQARVTSASDGNIEVTARDPEA
jgi:F0F1-type ATP synthase membrane subunit b/b'